MTEHDKIQQKNTTHNITILQNNTEHDKTRKRQTIIRRKQLKNRLQLKKSKEKITDAIFENTIEH